MMRSKLSSVVLSFVGACALALFAANCSSDDGDTTGTAGTGGAGTGGGGTGGPACDVPALFTAKSCAIDACHGKTSKAGGLDMETAGWETGLVGKAAGGTTTGPASLCGGMGKVYLVAGSNPATGLFIEKLKANPPCGERMPNLPLMDLTAAEIACVQSWANNLTK
jgi:hypothetical protein